MRGGAFAVAFILLVLGPAVAQETMTGSIAGRVLDPQGAAVPGATVTVVTPQGEKPLATDRNGRFFAPYLTPGTHAIRVELTGFKTIEQKGVVMRLGQRVELAFTLEVSAVQEVVEVVGSSPVIDVSSTTAGGVLGSDELQRLPVRRNLSQTLYLVPGVSESNDVGDANPSIAGASGLENSYVVDGVNITNTGFGGIGVYTIFFGSLGVGVTTDFVKETQVKTAGFEAEYGQATGGVVNVLTKSGTNAFHGSLFGYWRPIDLEGGWRELQTSTGIVNTTATENVDFGISAGGPLVRDRLFFFAAFNPQYRTRTLVAPEGFPLRDLGEVDQQRRMLTYAAKLTWQATERHRFDATVFGDPSRGPMGPQRSWVLRSQDDSAFSELTRYGGHNQALRYNGVLGTNWLVEASLAHAATIHEETPALDETRVSNYAVSPPEQSGGIGSYESGTDGSNLQLALKSTHLFDAGGRHELRYGVQLDDIEFTRIWERTGPPFTFHTGVQSRGGVNLAVLPDPVFGEIYRRAGWFGDPPASTQRYLSWFAQDTWRLGDRLTLRPGIRWEQQRLRGSQPICFDDEERVGDGGSGDGNPINCEYTWSHNWAPRLGVIWDPRGDGRAKLFASAGRFYVKMPNDLAVRSLSDEAWIRADYFDAEGTDPVPEGVLAAGTTWHLRQSSGHPALFANDSRMTFTDELVAGLEFEARPGLSLGVRYIHRDLSTVLEDYAQAQPVLYEIGFEGLQYVEYIIDNISAGLETLDPTSAGIPRAFFEDPVHKYDALEVTAQKAFSNRWSLLASYRWSRLRGNFEGFYRSDNGQADPAITSLFDFPTNDVSYTEIGVPQFGYQGDIRYQGTTLGEGRLPNDRPHQLKLYGSFAWRDLNLGVGLNAGSGRPLTALAANPTYTNPGEIPMTLRGAGLETVDGFRERAPAEVLLDLHVDYVIRFGRGRLLLIADVFNLLNDRQPTSYDPQVEALFRVPNPDFGQPRAPLGIWTPYPSYRTPRQVRLGARFEW